MKKTISVLMVFILILSVFSFASAAEPFSIGDVNGDGNVLADDARLALRASAKLEELSDQQRTAADVDNNGDVFADDARVILRVSAKLQDFGEKEQEPMPSAPADILRAGAVETGYNSELKEFYYHFSVKNISSEYAIEWPVITVEAVIDTGKADPSGAGVANPGDFPMIEKIRPGETVEIAGIIYDVDSAPSGATVQFDVNQNIDEDGKIVVMTKYTAYTGTGSFGALSVTNVNFFDGKITGTVKNNNDYTIAYASVYVLRMNGEKITAIDGLETQGSPVTGIPARGNASFEIAAEAAVGTDDKIVVCTDGAEADSSYDKVIISDKQGSVSPFGTLGVVFSAKNNDTTNALYSPMFRVSAFGAEDDSGERAVLGVGYVTAQYIAPGETLKIAAEACALSKANSNVAGFSITYAGCAFADKPTAGQKPLTTFDVSAGDKMISGYLTNPNGNDILNVTLSAVIYNADGSFRYVTSTVIEQIDKNESAPFDIPVNGKPAKAEYMALNWQEVANQGDQQKSDSPITV